MYKRLIYLIALVLALSLVGNVQAQTATWMDAGDHLWSTPANWSEFPTPAHWVKVRYGAPGATIANEGAEALKVSIGYEDGSALTVDGGSLTTVQYLALGRNGGSGTLNMIGGTITLGRDFEVGYGGAGIVNMTGGTIIVARDFMIPENSANTAHVNLDGGTIIVNRDLIMGEPGGTMNVAGGTLTINANALSTVQGYIDNGWITAYGGVGTVVLETVDDVLIVKGLHPRNPVPEDGGSVVPGNITLSWTVDEGTAVDVWLGTWPGLGGAELIVAKQVVTSVAVTVDPKQRYYWAVDTYAPGAADPNWGQVFDFSVDNQAPIVVAADDVATWLDNGSVEVAIAAAVTDLDPTTALWTVISKPNEGMAVIANPAQTETTVTLSALGTYVLQLEADDGEYKDADTLTIDVFSDHCEAAKSLPGWIAIPGDINLDCVVDQLDMDILIEQWLECNGLDCPDPNAP